MQLELNLNSYDKTENKVERNLYITNLKYLFQNDFNKPIQKIINSYNGLTIGEKRAAEISKKIAYSINKKSNRVCMYRVPRDKYYGDYYDTNGRKYDNYSRVDGNHIFIRTEKTTDYYGAERINVEIEYQAKHITTLYFDLKDGKFIYSPSQYEKYIYNQPSDVPELAQKIKDLYNNSITKIKELQEESKKQQDSINNNYMRSLTNGSLYIYGDYRDKLLED